MTIKRDGDEFITLRELFVRYTSGDYQCVADVMDKGPLFQPLTGRDAFGDAQELALDTLELFLRIEDEYIPSGRTADEVFISYAMGVSESIEQLMLIGAPRATKDSGTLREGDELPPSNDHALILTAWHRREPLTAIPVTVRYRNWRGETRTREIQPVQVYWGRSEWHPVSQWMLMAIDPEDGKTKQFALKDCDFTNLNPITT